MVKTLQLFEFNMLFRNIHSPSVLSLCENARKNGWDRLQDPWNALLQGFQGSKMIPGL